MVTSSHHPWAYRRLVEQKEPVFFASHDSLPPGASVDRTHWEKQGVQAMLMLPLHPGGQVSYLIGLWSGRRSEPWPTSHIRCLSFLGQILAKNHLRMRADKALLRSERELIEAQRISRLGSWHWDIIGGNLHWSDEVYRILGLLPQEFDPT